MTAWANLATAGIGLASALLNKPYAAVKQYSVQQYATKEYSYSTKPVPDNSIAVYNRAYGKMVKRMNSLEVMFKGERDITTARLKGVKERMAIGLSQDEAEAQIKLNAAAAGVTGGSIEENIYQTHANAAFRTGDQATGEDNSIERAIQAVYKGKQGSFVTKDDYSVHTQFTGGDSVTSSGGGPPIYGDYEDTDNFSLGGAILGSLSTLDSQFWNDLGLAFEDMGPSSQDFQVGNDWDNTYNVGLA